MSPGIYHQVEMRILLLVSLAFAGLSCAPEDQRPAGENSSAWEIVSWEYVDDLPEEIAVLETVFWEPDDTVSLRKLIRETAVVNGKTVLEIGTGSGLLSLYALQFGGAKVVATDVNPAAVANARFNARRLGFEERFEARRVPLDQSAAYSVIDDSETFDVIVSNPPWVDRRPSKIEEYALYDEGFHLLHTLLSGLEKHLNPGGKALLAYGSVDGIRTVMKMAAEMNLEVRVVDDDRDLDELDEEFLPGMLLEVTMGRPEP